MLGKNPIKRMQRPDMTIAVDWDLKHQFKQIQITNIRYVPMGVLKTEGVAKIIFDRYYWINSAKYERNYYALYFTASSRIHTHKCFRSYACSGRTSVTHY